MTAYHLFSILAFMLASIGLYGAVAQLHLVRKIIAINIMSGGVFLFLVATAWRDAAPRPDPVPHAMVLTGIVISVSATAFALALVRRIHRGTGIVRLEEVGPEDEEQETAR